MSASMWLLALSIPIAIVATGYAIGAFLSHQKDKMIVRMREKKS